MCICVNKTPKYCDLTWRSNTSQSRMMFNSPDAAATVEVGTVPNSNGHPATLSEREAERVVLQDPRENEQIAEQREQQELFVAVDRSGRDLLQRLNKPVVDMEFGPIGSNGLRAYRSIRVTLPPNPQKQLVTLLKELGGRWSPQDMFWRLPPYLAYGISLEEQYGWSWVKPEFSDSFKEWRDTAYQTWEGLRVPETIRPVWDKLYPFQKDAVVRLVENPWGHRGQLLVLSPGLGKTVVAMVAAAILGYTRVLIVCPLTLLRVWLHEKSIWFPRGGECRLPAPFRMIHGKAPPAEGWVVTNYNTVTSPRRNADYWEEQWQLVILDESVSVKNRKSQRFANIKNLSASAEMFWELSGSPITRHPNDLWTQFHLIEPRAWTAYWRFTKRWCSVEDSVWGTKIGGSSGRNLRTDFEDIMFVRNQEEVLPDLPEMIHQNISVMLEHEQSRQYNRMLTEFVAVLDRAESEGIELDAPSKLAQLTRLQQITSNLTNLSTMESVMGVKVKKQAWPDASGKADVLEQLFESEAIEFPCLIWTHWKPGAHALQSRLEPLLAAQGYKVAVVTGESDEAERGELLQRFKGSKSANEKSDIDVLILALGVGKFGLSLTNSRTIVYMDKTWSADDYMQSLYRVRRIGLTHTPRVISLVAPGTIDDMVEDNLAGKLPDIAHVTNSTLKNLLRALRKYGEGGEN